MIFCISLLGATINAQDTKAEIQFKTDVIDYGEIAKGSNGIRKFKFTNTGNAPLVIVDAKSSCGCTVPEYTKDPVAPGEGGEMLVKFNGSGKNQVSKTVTITANTAAGTETIKIKAFINAPEGAVPGQANAVKTQ